MVAIYASLIAGPRLIATARRVRAGAAVVALELPVDQVKRQRSWIPMPGPTLHQQRTHSAITSASIDIDPAGSAGSGRAQSPQHIAHHQESTSHDWLSPAVETSMLVLMIVSTVAYFSASDAVHRHFEFLHDTFVKLLSFL